MTKVVNILLILVLILISSHAAISIYGSLSTPKTSDIVISFPTGDGHICVVSRDYGSNSMFCYLEQPK